MAAPTTRRIVSSTLIAIGACLFIAIFSINPSIYAGYIASVLSSQAKRAGIYLSTDGERLRGFGISVENLSLTFPEILTTFDLTEVTLALRPLQLLLLRYGVDGHGSAYGGTVDLLLSGRGDSFSLLGSAAALQLPAHPQLAALGITGGTLRLDELKLLGGSRGVRNSRFRGAITDLEKGEQTPYLLPAALALQLTQMTGFPIPQRGTLPPFGPFTIEVDGETKITTANLRRVKVSSPFGLLLARGTVQFGGAAPHLNVKMSVMLSREGMQHLAPLLPLISRQRVPSGANAFRVTVRGRLEPGAVEFGPCDEVCQRELER